MAAVQFKAIEPPKYNGAPDYEEIIHFTDAADSYFQVTGMTEPQKYETLVGLLTGPAAIWFRGAYPRTQPLTYTWADIKRALKAQFLPVNYTSNLMQQYRGLKQTGTVQEYTAKFRSLLRQLQDNNLQPHLTVQTEDYLMGLKPQTRLQVVMS